MGWDDVIGVDFTRTAQSVQRTGADLQKWAKQQETKATTFIIVADFSGIAIVTIPYLAIVL